MFITQEQRTRAMKAVNRSIDFRMEYNGRLRRNSFANRGNEVCIARALQTLADMQNDVASPAQWRYWLNK